jgi:hypothetical protein
VKRVQSGVSLDETFSGDPGDDGLRIPEPSLGPRPLPILDLVIIMVERNEKRKNHSREYLY